MPNRQYDVVALPIPVIFNKRRDHDPGGMMYALARNADTVLKHEAEMYRNSLAQAGASHYDGCGCSESAEYGHAVDPEVKFKPHPLVRPLVLRATKGETVVIRFTNRIKCRQVGMHLVGPGTAIASDGAHAGLNTTSLAAYDEVVTYEWRCENEGTFLFHDIGDPAGDEQGTNAHGLFGALIVEPKGAWWTDPARDFDDPRARVDDGLYVDVHQRPPAAFTRLEKPAFAGKRGSQRPPKYPDRKSSFREFVLFIHDEPEVWELKQKSEKEYRACHEFHCARGTGGGTGNGHGDGHHDAGNGAHGEPAHAAVGSASTRGSGAVPAGNIICAHAHMVGPAFDGLPRECDADAKYGMQQSAAHHQAGAKDEPQVFDIHQANEACEPGEWRVLRPHGGSLMCLNYRAEPMKNREHQIWDRLEKGTLKKTVINEEQHHSSWMFGDPDTPILKAYMGDPVRIRLIHAGVKETHVFHLHVYEWHTDPGNRCSPLIDAITIAPGTAHTIEPLFGAGNLQAVPGDVIWHCHLYPHFHMGMWGMFRTFDKLQSGESGALLQDPDSIYDGRRLGQYPDGTPIARLAVLPDRGEPPAPTPLKPGFPLFIGGEIAQKSPLPPWPKDYGGIPSAQRSHYDYRKATALELKAMNRSPKPGELFTVFPHPAKRSLWVSSGKDCVQSDLLVRSTKRAQVDKKIAVGHGRIDYNSHGWHDPDGHFYYLDTGKKPPEPDEPLFFRANHGDVLNLTFTNRIGFRKPEGPSCAADGSPVPQPERGQLERMYFDYNIPPSDKVVVDGKTPAECGLHVHLVKFDPICADGAATGWNYLSGPSNGKKMVYRWWCDEEFGVIFCHDHLFANTRQRHGLFGALIVEPEDAKFLDPKDHSKEINAGTKAVIQRQDGSKFREFGIGIGDWIAMYDKNDQPLDYPDHPSSHGDNGVMCVNYKNAPLHERGTPPHTGFADLANHEDQALTFDTYPGEEIKLRLIQGSHEEQHSFQVNGLNWRRFVKDAASPQRSQQTLGISEAFTFAIKQPYAVGDYLWRFSGQDDTWLGCWGRLRVHSTAVNGLPAIGRPALPAAAPASLECRRYVVRAVQEKIIYRNAPTALADPCALVDTHGLRFVVSAVAAPGASLKPIAGSGNVVEPMILRCLQGEWVEIEVENGLTESITAEHGWPELPVEKIRNIPPISQHVSLEADLLTQYVRQPDGTVARPAPVATVAPDAKRTFLFHANTEPGSVLLQDMADIRNHRHHGLFGALIIEPKGSTPLAVEAGETSAISTAEAWTGSRATLVNGKRRVEECVLILHDGVRYVDPLKPFSYPPENCTDPDAHLDAAAPHHPPAPHLGRGGHAGAPTPLLDHSKCAPNPPDIPGDMGEARPDTEDQGHKAFNYRSARLDRAFEAMKPCRDERGEPQRPNQHDRAGWQWFAADPPTPVFHVTCDAAVEVKLICAADKPRNHSFTIHGHSWLEYPHRNTKSVRHSAVDGLATGATRTLAFTASAEAGDYLYRSGVLKWGLAQGLWGILRVKR